MQMKWFCKIFFLHNYRIAWVAFGSKEEKGENYKQDGFVHMPIIQISLYMLYVKCNNGNFLNICGLMKTVL